MFKINLSRHAIGILLGIALTGCAPAYRAYPNACVPYCYCPEPPLPYGTYGECHCPTPIASEFVRQHGPDMPAAID